MPTVPLDLQPRRIRGLGHWRAVRAMLRDYAPGVDALVDMLRAMRFPLGPIARQMAAPIYFAREQGWMLRGPRDEIAAVIYLLIEQRGGVGVVHIDDVNVSAAYRRQGLAQRLFALAEETARGKGYRYTKLAVQVANTPAVTLYRRLGYQEQHHRFFTVDAGALGKLATHAEPGAGALHVRPLSRAAAAEQSRSVFRAEWAASSPDTAPVMAAYYAPRVPLGALWTEAIAHDGRDVGYWSASRTKQSAVVVLGLLPELWGGEVERAVLRLLAERASQFSGGRIRLWAMSGGHHRALCEGQHSQEGAASLAETFGLADTSDDRMIMVKVLPQD